MHGTRRWSAATAVAALVLVAGCTGPDEYAEADGPPTPHPLRSPTASPDVPALPVAPEQPSHTVLPSRTVAGQAQLPPATTPPTVAPPVRATSGTPVDPRPVRTVTRTVTVTVSPAVTPTQRHRPGWISEFFSNDDGMVGDGESCVRARAGEDGALLTLKRLEPGEVCARGFAAEPAPKLVIEAPSGVRTALGGADAEDGRWRLRPGAAGSPMDEFGTYRFEVTGRAEKVNTDPGRGPVGQRLEVTARGEIAVVQGLAPYADFGFDDRAGWPERVRPGARLTVRLAGYTPHSRVEITAYRLVPERNGFTVFADLPDVLTDRFGEGRITWTLPATAQPGTYGWLVAPEPWWPMMDDNGLSVYLDVVRR